MLAPTGHAFQKAQHGATHRETKQLLHLQYFLKMAADAPKPNKVIFDQPFPGKDIPFSPLKKTSYKIHGNPQKDTWLQQTCSRANLRACGFKDEDFGKPFITIAAP
jgi:hypothetical protein